MNNYNNIVDTIENKPTKGGDDNKTEEEIKQEQFESLVSKFIYKKKKKDYILEKKSRHNIIRMKMKRWLLKDLGDELILLDILKNAFDDILYQTNIKLSKINYRTFFTVYCNWIYKHTVVHD